MKSLVFQIIYDSKTNNILTSKNFHAILLAVCLLPLTLKKEIKELKIASFVLYLGIVSFILILFFQLIIEGNYMNLDEDYSEYMTVNWDLSIIKSCSILICAVCYQFNLFPVVNSMQDKTTENVLTSCRRVNVLMYCFYTAVGVLSIYTFG